jgi:hypothetical protein
MMLAGGRVLFIGNSLTEANGLPAMVETLSHFAVPIDLGTMPM